MQDLARGLTNALNPAIGLSSTQIIHRETRPPALPDDRESRGGAVSSLYSGKKDQYLVFNRYGCKNFCDSTYPSRKTIRRLTRAFRRQWNQN
ncbi:hypothetical protein TNCT_106771 [Trichonephila clavata]|uniref:Uncharacterized protein n=1 Tax=Trichonephila clavata TaxID=2740835 RepID=A0A8X6HZE6_TRICU|nr:hypothetical protein TNCT_106771 [Trichonephila clavata]